MRGTQEAPTSAVRLGDVVITLVLLVTFVAAFLSAQQWPFEARLFPQMLATAGMGFAALQLACLGVQAHRRRAWVRRLGPGDAVAGENEVGDPDGTQDEDPDYMFGSAGRREWAKALGWVTAFFVALWALGVFVAVAAFAFTYLKVAGGNSWLAATVYAGVAGGLLWLVFGYFLAVPMPAGIGII